MEENEEIELVKLDKKDAVSSNLVADEKINNAGDQAGENNHKDSKDVVETNESNNWYQRMFPTFMCCINTYSDEMLIEDEEIEAVKHCQNEAVSTKSNLVGNIHKQTKFVEGLNDSSMESCDSKDWPQIFDPEIKDHALHGNSIKSRVFVVSGNYQQDEEYIRSLKLKSNIQWKITNFVIPEYSGLPGYSIDKSADDLIKEIKDYCPTNLILNKVRYNQNMIDLICNHNIFKSISVVKENFQFIELTNMFQPLECILMNSVETETYDWKKDFLNLLQEGSVKNDETTVVTILSGTESDFTNCADIKDNMNMYLDNEETLRTLKQQIKEANGSCYIKFNLVNIKSNHVCLTKIPSRFPMCSDGPGMTGGGHFK